MGNFDFVQHTLPRLYHDAARAESYVTSDPRSACFYARRTVEELVDYLYGMLGLETPYKDDLAAKIANPEFRRITGDGIAQKMTLIRKMGNTAVHAAKQIPAPTALSILRELYHVMIWAAFNYSAHPDDVPTGTQFDPAQAAKAAPLTQQDVIKLAKKFQEQDQAHAKELADKDEAAAKLQEELDALRLQVKAAQQTKTVQDTHDYSEAETRDLFIDVLLNEAGWPLEDQRDREFEVTGMPDPNTGTPDPNRKGYVDYVLWGTDGIPLALIEAKRTRKSPQVGQQQAKLYADALERQFHRRPVIFSTNGYEHWLWDDAAGYPPRQVQGFYTRDQLELAIQRRHTKLTLTAQPISTDIVERPYQTRAIKAVDQAFDAKQRTALLAMATGSGKTRVVIALVDQLQKANWAKRVLFLADRTALVTQAANAFKAHLPAATTVNLVTEKQTDARVYVSTYPTMMNLIDQVSDTGERRFGPGYFDLIVIDEAHRSVYAKYGAIFEWFDAMLVGLTATPKDEVDHNTYRLFNLEDGVPTDAYTLDEAVADGFLVPPRGVSAETKFLRQGITYADLTEQEKEEWDALDWGDDEPPSEINAAELNHFLFNEDTVDKVLGTLMERGRKVAGGDRLGKTIIFAKNQKHAEFIARRFDQQYPEFAGHFARVITHAETYAQSLIDAFSDPAKDPHIAISVDMLDTGIDVPEVVNLVFFKTVHSKSKFWQMIGRGTRLRPDLYAPGEDKADFLVFDFCGNLEYFSQDLPAAEGTIGRSLSWRLFDARLRLLRALDTDDADPDLRASTAHSLHGIVAGMSLDNFLVRPQRRLVERYSNADAWKHHLTEDQARDLLNLAGLPSELTDNDEAAKRFDLLMLRRQLADVEGDTASAEKIRKSVQAIAASLLTMTAIPTVKEQAVLLEEVAGDDWWVDVTLAMLESARTRLRGLVRFIEKTSQNPIYADFEDQLGDFTDVDLPGTTTGTDLKRFRTKAAAYLRQHEDQMALQKLRRNRQLTSQDIQELQRMLEESGIGTESDIVQAATQGGGLGLFIRSLVGLDRSAAQEAFAAFLDDGRFTVDQIRFVDLIVDELTQNGVMDAGRLFEAPYIDHAPTGPDYLFPRDEVAILVNTLNQVAAHALPQAVASR